MPEPSTIPQDTAVPAPGVLRALAALARTDATRHVPGSAIPTAQADAAGARYWLERLADQTEAVQLLDAARHLWPAGPAGDAQHTLDKAHAAGADLPLVAARVRIGRREYHHRNLGRAS